MALSPRTIKSSPLVQAAGAGDLPSVSHLSLSNSHEPKDYDHALIAACHGGHLAIAELLLQLPGIDVTARDNQAIISAASSGNVLLVDRLLQLPAVNASARDNEAICLAASSGSVAVIDRLLQIPAVNATAQSNRPLALAASKNHVAVIDRLLQVPGVTPVTPYHYAMIWGAQHGSQEALARLLPIPGANINAAIYSACCSGKLDLLKWLLQWPGADLADKRQRAVTAAVQNNLVTLVEYLLQQPRVDVTANQNRAFLAAVSSGFTAMVKVLLKVPAVVETVPQVGLNKFKQAVDSALSCGHFEMMEVLMAQPSFVPLLTQAFPQVDFSCSLPLSRHFAAIRIASARCVPHRKSDMATRILEAYHIAYGVVWADAFPVGINELVCQYAAARSPIIMTWTLNVHQQLRDALNNLRKVRKPKH